jgi:hypothetical protein
MDSPTLSSTPSHPPLSVQEQLSRALAELRANAAEAAALRSEAEELRAKAAENVVLRAELRAEADVLRAKATVAEADHYPPPGVQAMFNQALAELKAKADGLQKELLEEKKKRHEHEDSHEGALVASLKEKAAEADHLREALEEKEAELLRLRKQHESVRHEDTLFHSVVTVTSKTKMEKTGTSLIHTKPNQLRSLFVEALDQALPSPPSAGAPPPAAIVHALSEKGAVALLYRNLAVRNKGGMTSTELFELHLHVAEDAEDPNLVTLRTLSDDEAERICGEHYARQVEAKRAKVDLRRKLKRVQVRSYANGSERQRSVSVSGACVVGQRFYLRSLLLLARSPPPPPLTGVSAK